MSDDRQPCPTEGCRHTKPRGVRLCRDCWYGLPSSLRGKVAKAMVVNDTDALEAAHAACVKAAGKAA